ncbi:hypothetical protein SAMN02745207_03682 [Clostridium grantii DSM 8605]|uniref:Uncharacterized protein n=1 Tax=Clostridium grantii DSM 8605 TaxID=1121316 RepID=A0A1M5XIL5_9CLOT|nr:hypothetical protein SAMN02745207_03682 [Clostridium grantii DSM 8605]
MMLNINKKEPRLFFITKIYNIDLFSLLYYNDNGLLKLKGGLING